MKKHLSTLIFLWFFLWACLVFAGPHYIKPAIWACDPGTVAYNCARMGLPMPVLAMPVWEKAGGKIFDYGGRKDNGDISGAIWRNQGLYFDGTGDWVVVPDYDGITNQISVFVIASRGNTTAFNHMISRHPGWALSADTGNFRMRFIVNTGSEVEVVFDIFTNIPQDVFFSYCATYNGAVIKTYLNGIYKNQSNQTGNVNLTGYTRIGRYHGGTGFNWIGNVRLVILFKQALTSHQVQILNNDPYGMFEPIPTAWYIPSGVSTCPQIIMISR